MFTIHPAAAAMALLFATCLYAPAMCAEIPNSATSSLRTAITDAFAVAQIQDQDLPSADVRRTVGTRIDSKFLDGAVTVTGTDMRFTPTDKRPRHAGVLVLRYASAAIASTRLGSRKDGIFRDTKILTPMTIARSGATIAIFYTESGGDPRMRALLADLARRLI